MDLFQLTPVFLNFISSIKYLPITLFVVAVNLGYAVVGLLGTPLVRHLGRDWLSYIITLIAIIWYFLWWKFVEETLNPNRPIRDVSSILYLDRNLLTLLNLGTSFIAMEAIIAIKTRMGLRYRCYG